MIPLVESNSFPAAHCLSFVFSERLLTYGENWTHLEHSTDLSNACINISRMNGYIIEVRNKHRQTDLDV